MICSCFSGGEGREKIGSERCEVQKLQSSCFPNKKPNKDDLKSNSNVPRGGL